MTIEELNKACEGSFIDHIGIQFIELEGSEIAGTIEITDAHMQPAGYVHGGVYISLAETLAGAASSVLLEGEDKIAFGTTVNSQHVASVREGKITAVGTLIYKGIFKHIWDINITDLSGKLISISRVTNSIKELKQIQDQ